MEIFGGFMVMMSIISLFLAVVWLIMPFVVFAIKGKQDRTLEVLEAMEKRLAAIESRTLPVVQDPQQDTSTSSTAHSTTSPDESTDTPSDEHSTEHTVTLTGAAPEKNGSEPSPVV